MPRDVGRRKANCVPRDEVHRVAVTWDDMSRWRAQIVDHINKGRRFDKGTFHDETFETDYHGNGHVIIALNCKTEHGSGIMLAAASSARDPVFYRWHQHIDDLAKMYFDRLPR